MSTARAQTSGPLRLRRSLERLGPVYVKIGQCLALRPDLLPREYCDELMTLTDEVEPLPFAAIEQVVSRSLGAALTERFALFDHRPLAAGCLTQLHRARTLDGRSVVVKVKRPGVEQLVKRSLARANAISHIVKSIGKRPAFSTHQMVAEARRWLQRELDLRNERNNLSRLAKMAGDVTAMQVPWVAEELCAADVLTTELLVGIPMPEILQLARAGRVDKIQGMGFDSDELAQNLRSTMLAQIFDFQFFHAEVHPSNLLALSDNRIGFVDVSLAETVDSSLRRGMIRFLAAVADEDVDTMYSSLLDLLIRSAATGEEGFRSDFVARTRVWLRESRSTGRTEGAGASLVREYLIEVLSLTRLHGLRMPAPMLAIFRALVTSEAVAVGLGGRTDLVELSQSYARSMQLEELLHSLEPREIGKQLFYLYETQRRVPARLDNILDSLSRGELTLRVLQAESAAATRRKDDRAKLIAAGVVSISFSVIFAGAGANEILGLSLRLIAGVLTVASLLAVLVLWSRLR